MANGDTAAALIGWTPVLASDDLRLGYDRVNQLADLVASLTSGGWTVYASAAALTAAGFTVQANWALVSGASSKLGSDIALRLVVQRTTSALAATSASDGDVPNQPVAGLPSSLTPTQSNGSAGPISAGAGKFGYASSGGTLVLTAITPGQTIAIGDQVELSIMYHK